MHLLVIMRLGSAKARDKLAPLLDCPAVTRVTADYAFEKRSREGLQALFSVF